MEVPKEYKKLYKHWHKHTKVSLNFNTNLSNNTLVSDINSFASERMNIWERKYCNEKPPYTDDPILQKYRFCNIYRELDRQTIQIHKSLIPLKNDFYLWLLNLSFQRFVSNPDTIKFTGFISLEEKNNKEVYDKLVSSPSPKYGTAYMFPISAIQNSRYNTREKFFIFYLPEKIKEIGDILKSFNSISVNEALEQILPVFGFNLRFHWTEILIDVAYQYPQYLDLYRDFHIGPGALPTLKELGSDISLEDLVKTKLDNFEYLEYNGKPVYLSAENWEGIACEFRKYKNLKKGSGRKRYYNHMK